MSQPVFSNGYALLIGVGNDLPATVKDATALRDIFISPYHAAYPKEQVELLTEANADRKNILDAFDRLIEKVKNNPDATVIVYFSGHGGQINRGKKSLKYFLIPYGYDAKRRSDTAITGSEFTQKIEAIHARKLIVFLDCCHAGGIPALKDASEIFEKSSFPSGLLNILETGTGRVVVASSTANEVSYAGTPYSIFTACLLDALEGKASKKKDGFARIFDTLIYLFEQVPERTSDRQHPFVNKMLNLGDNFPLCYYSGGKNELITLSEPVLTATLSPRKRRQLEERQEMLLQNREAWMEIIRRLRRARMYEDNPVAQYKLEYQIQEREIELTKVDSELDEIEQKLQV